MLRSALVRPWRSEAPRSAGNRSGGRRNRSGGRRNRSGRRRYCGGRWRNFRCRWRRRRDGRDRKRGRIRGNGRFDDRRRRRYGLCCANRVKGRHPLDRLTTGNSEQPEKGEEHDQPKRLHWCIVHTQHTPCWCFMVPKVHSAHLSILGHISRNYCAKGAREADVVGRS